MATRIGLVEALGLSPFDKAAREAWLTLRGDPSTPKSRFGLSSLRQLKPRWSVPLWLGQKPKGRLVPVTNLYNYRQPKPELGWSVRVTDVLDFRGGGNTYDSHNGTDLAIPPGTEVVAAAPGVVLRVSSEFHRGGRKIFMDHGRGLVTTYNHLSRPLALPGQRVRRGELIALSGYSGIDALVGFPWTPPHVHFNCWLGGVYVDPFAPRGASEASLWRGGACPTPAREAEVGEDDYEPTQWNLDAVDGILSHCRHEGARAEISGATTVHEMMGAALMQLNYFPTRFPGLVEGGRSLYLQRFEREPRLDLPFSYRDYDGVWFPQR